MFRLVKSVIMKPMVKKIHYYITLPTCLKLLNNINNYLKSNCSHNEDILIYV